MQYEEALRRWGAAKIKAEALAERERAARRGEHTEAPIPDPNPDEVTVRFVYEEGHKWSSWTEDMPRAEVEITCPGWEPAYIEGDDFDFAATLAEIIEAGGGAITIADQDRRVS